MIFSSSENAECLCHSSHTNQVIIDLDSNFIIYAQPLTEVNSLLKSKMMHVRGKTKPFSMFFKVTHIFGNYSDEEEEQDDQEGFINLKSPQDVKISYSLGLILISDTFNDCIQIFHLHSKMHLTCINSLMLQMKQPSVMCIEEEVNDDKNCSTFCHLIVSSIKNGQKGVYKYDLTTLLSSARNYEQVESRKKRTKSTNTKQSFLWKASSTSNLGGIALLKKDVLKNSNVAATYNYIYVCDTNRDNIHILNSTSGQIIQSISVKFPLSVTFTQSNYLNEIQSDSPLSMLVLSDKKIERFEMVMTQSKNGSKSFEEHDVEWKKIMSFDAFPTRYYFHSTCIVYDPLMKCVIFGNTQIRIFNLQGNCEKSSDNFKMLSEHGDVLLGPFEWIHGMVLNELSGELLVCDLGNKLVLVLE
ncbi:hypothetical protein C9374_005129 [Naegleria lovaniensis]|uniref:Uncharacterized protein n=1 Tax=Naegleria lovaniensis TaxID=51637 RepID=A0AA88KI81_NAELO|nr:uncharacterized protein C9374_005129 [Naegleria lovaniensis]KAG2382549.1 hypothetical protein C9374_005129 [Naegleria lovaniensis]